MKTKRKQSPYTFRFLLLTFSVAQDKEAKKEERKEPPAQEPPTVKDEMPEIALKEKVEKEEPKDLEKGEVYYQKGVKKFNEGKYEEALEEFKKSAEKGFQTLDL